MSELVYKGGAQNGHPFRNVQRGTICVNESGLCALILRSQLESACAFKRWVTKDVLPSIRKTGRYDYCIDHKYNNKIESKTDLHVKVIQFLKKRYPHSLFTVTLGENQDTVYKRIDSFKGEQQRENKLISYERASKMLENDMYITGIGQAVLELLSFKVESGNHQRGISLLQKFLDIFGNIRLVLLKMTSDLTSHNFQILKIEIFSKLCKI